MKVIFSIFVLFISLFSLTLPSYAAEKTASKVAPKAQQIASATININTASAQQLADQLVGIGLSRASKIVAYRKANGRSITPMTLLPLRVLASERLSVISRKYV